MSTWLNDVSLTRPNFVIKSAWREHAPFGFWITSVVKPKVFVELGVQHGFSYFAICQVLCALNIGARAYGIDKWKGDEHSGFYGADVRESARKYNDSNYSSFSTLIESTFDAALPYFSDRSIDLLHIDGRHRYEDVKHDFESWLPKLSDRAVVLIHDTNVRERGFGVSAFWSEVSEQYPSFEFFHGHGLGVLGCGSELNGETASFFRSLADESSANGVREVYAKLGRALVERIEDGKIRKRLEETTSQYIKSQESADKAAREIERWRIEARDLQHQLGASQKRIETLETRLSDAKARRRQSQLKTKKQAGELKHFKRSLSWKLTRPVRAVEVLFSSKTRNSQPSDRLQVHSPSITKKHSTQGRAGVKNVAITITKDSEEKGLRSLRQWHSLINEAGEQIPKWIEEGVVRACYQYLTVGQNDEAGELANLALNRWPNQRNFLVLQGILLLRAKKNEEAKNLWGGYWERALRDPLFIDEYLFKPKNSLLGNGVFSKKKFNSENQNILGAKKICVYTAEFGGYDRVIPPIYLPNDIDFICFTDRQRESTGWDMRVVDLDISSPHLKNRKIKILPYEYLQDYTHSIYVDSNILFLSDLSLLIEKWLSPHPFVAWPHPERSDVYEELETILAQLKADPSTVLAETNFFKEEGLPNGTGLLEAAFLWRDHRDPLVRRLMEKWWEHLAEFGGRDQPGLGYWMWKTDIRPTILPEHLGTSRANEFYIKLKHNRSFVDQRRDAVERPKSTNEETGSSSSIVNYRNGPPTTSIAPSRKRPIVWLYRPQAVQTATMMRGYQLSQLAKERLSGEIEVKYVPSDRLEDVADSIVILTRSFLRNASLEELIEIRKTGNVICVDNVDHAANGALHDAVDVYISSSIKQYLYYLNNYKEKIVHHITHNVDPLIKGIDSQKISCNIAYFGEMVNAAHREELFGYIDFVQTNNVIYARRDWIGKLNFVNTHYAVREKQPSKGQFKPFTKGFTAAHCNSNIIVSIKEGDVLHYLGSEYPYLLKNESLKHVMEMIDYVKDSFGSAEWRLALDMMESVKARSSPDQISREIRDLVNAINR